MEVFSPPHFFATLALMCKNLRFILLRGNTIVARLLLYFSAVVWGTSTLFFPTQHWQFLTEIIKVSPNLLHNIVVCALPLGALIYGITSIVVMLAKVKIPLLTITSSVVGALLWTTATSLDIAIYTIMHDFSNNFTEVEPTAITATLLAWWLLARDLLKVNK